MSAGRENQYQITFGAPIQVNGNASQGKDSLVSIIPFNPYQNLFTDGANQKNMDPLFVTPPPKTQRLLHSEAYIK